MRECQPTAKVVGFQHAFVSKNSFKYLLGKDEKSVAPLPDRIVTMGSRTRDIMQRLGDYPIGIFKQGCALRQEYLCRLSVLTRKIDGAIFVPLSIAVEDTVKVLRFLLVTGLDRDSRRVYLRFHPATPVDRVLARLASPLPENFLISECPPVNEELSRASVVLYTWTTICAEAVRLGRPAIYLDVNYPYEMDPLFESDDLKSVCRDPRELRARIDEWIEMDEGEFQERVARSQRYLDEYFAAINENGLNAFCL